jgi:homoserine acetyltransferase
MSEIKYFHKELVLSPSSEPALAKFPAKLAYKTYGSPSNPAVLLSSAFLGSLDTTTPFLYTGDDAILSPERFYIIVVGVIGGGESSSPSNQPAPYDGPRFPKTTYQDNIHLQYSLCTEELGLSQLFAYIGYSMGGQQAYHMVTMYPDFVQAMVGLSTSARTSTGNWMSLEGNRYALMTAHDFYAGDYKQQQPPQSAKDGVKAFMRVQAGRAHSPGWFREQCWLQAGFASLDAYLEAWWTNGPDANDLLAMLWTWQHADLAVVHPDEDQGDLAKALGRIKARCLLVPCSTDIFFPPEDSREEVRHLANGELAILDSVWGHLAGLGSKKELDFMSTMIKEFLRI